MCKLYLIYEFNLYLSLFSVECKEKISELEKTKKLHENWLQETTRLQLRHAGDGEIAVEEEISEEEYIKQKGKLNFDNEDNSKNI